MQIHNGLPFNYGGRTNGKCRKQFFTTKSNANSARTPNWT